MKPYYEHGGITIYHGDCRELLPQFAEDSIDLIVTDPPYGVRWESNYRQKSFGEIAGDHSREAGEIALALCMTLLRNRRHAYVFGQFDFDGLPISDVVELIWDKGNIGGGDLSLPWAKQHEYIQFFASCKSWKNYTNGQGRLTARLRKGSILSYPRLNALQVADHPTEKPVMLLRELIESSSRFGELVLDPFMGSGSCAQAALLEGRMFCGIEIEEKYCEIAVKRLSQGEIALQKAIEINGPPCPQCGAGMCEHGICDNYCNNNGEPCSPCFRMIGADNVVTAERNAAAKAMNLIGESSDE